MTRSACETLLLLLDANLGSLFFFRDLKVTIFNDQINAWDVSQVTPMHKMFFGMTDFCQEPT